MTEVGKVLGVLVEHSIVRGIRSMQTHCKCGWISVAQADGWHEHAHHQAVQIVAARRSKSKKAAS
jgi:hypothetical protein